MTEFAGAVYRLLTEIPKGKVTTYGAIAARLGRPGAARAVGNILHENPRPDLYPCFRVVNGQGRPAPNFGLGGPEIQQAMLEADGIEVKDGRVDLGRYLYRFGE